MNDVEYVAHLLSRRCFVEAAYFGVLCALRAPTAEAHMFTGVGCCGCAAPLAHVQRLLEGVPMPDEKSGVDRLRISPGTPLPYEEFYHLLEAVRLNPAITAPDSLREVFDAVADDLAYVSRRELRGSLTLRRYSHRTACLAAALLLRRMTGTDRALPGVLLSTPNVYTQIIEKELSQSGGDALFYSVLR